MQCERCPHEEHSGRVCGADVTAQVADLLRAHNLTNDLRVQDGNVLIRMVTAVVTCACGTQQD